MRAYIVTFSSIAFALLIALGVVFNLLSGWQIDVPSPYNYPPRVVGTLLGDAPGLIFALAGLGYALYDAARRNATRWFIALLIWPVIPLLAASLMFAGALSYAGLWFVPLALITLAPFIYGIIAASPGPRPAPLAPAPRRYITFVGILATVTVVLGALLIAPVPQSLAGPELVSPPVLQVNPLQTGASCAKGIYPQVTLANVGAQTITWTARSQDPNVTVTPSSGTLAPNSAMQVALEGATSARQVKIQFTPNIGTGFTTEFICH
jgi:hypothetical protein